jgi:hypothetical protein
LWFAELEKIRDESGGWAIFKWVWP